MIELRDVAPTRRASPALPKVAPTIVARKARATKSPRKATGRPPLLVIDGDSFVHRAYHALPKSIRGKGDRPAGAILGFANLLLRLYREEKPRAVLVGWDTYEEPTYRHEAFAAYQSGREFDDELLAQLAVIPDFVTACGFANAKRAGYEADDFLASAATAEERSGGTALIASGDRDTFQLASARTTILYPIPGGGMERIGPAEVRGRYGVDPDQVPDFIALRGDPSDKLPGAPGPRSTRAAESGGDWSTSTLDLHDALGMIRVIGDYQAQARWPIGAGTKTGHGICGQRQARFNFDLHTVTKAPENQVHVIDRVRFVLRHRGEPTSSGVTLHSLLRSVAPQSTKSSLDCACESEAEVTSEAALAETTRLVGHVLAKDKRVAGANLPSYENDGAVSSKSLRASTRA